MAKSPTRTEGNGDDDDAGRCRSGYLARRIYKYIYRSRRGSTVMINPNFVLIRISFDNLYV